MEQSFELTVRYRDHDKRLPAKLVTMGYTYKIFVDIEGTELIFEPDEERNFRAIFDPANKGAAPSSEYITAIGQALEKELQ